MLQRRRSGRRVHAITANPELLSAAYDTLAPVVYAYALWLVGAEAAEHSVLAAFLQLWRQPHKLSTPDAALPYLIGCLRRDAVTRREGSPGGMFLERSKADATCGDMGIRAV